MAQHNNLGQRGEQLACDYLRAKGFKLLETNWRWEHLEIDIIAQEGETLVFVEVKTRRPSAIADPTDAVDIRKQMNIIQAANEFVDKYQLNMDSRFDVISIVVYEDRYEILHFPDAFYPVLQS